MKKTDIVFYILFAIATIALTTLTIIFHWSFLALFSCLSGTYGVYLQAKRKRIGLLIYLASNLAYVYIAYKIKYFGDALFYLLVSTPFIIVSYIMWGKNLDEDKLVKPRRMTWLVRITSLVVAGLSVFAFGLILKHFGGTNPYIDAASTVSSLFAFCLMLLRYKEQWTCWIAQYLISIVMYILVKDVLITALCVFNTIESFLGDYLWNPGKDKNNIILKQN